MVKDKVRHFHMGKLPFNQLIASMGMIMFPREEHKGILIIPSMMPIT